MSFPRYPSYRESGIDWFDTIPAHWGLERLRHLVTLNPSKSEIGDMPDDMKVTFLPMEAIGETGEIDVTRTRPLAELKNGYTYFADGDLVFAKVTPCFENGKGALIEGLLGGYGFGTTELTVLRPHAPADAQFLRWLIFSDLFRGPGSGEMLGAGGLKRVPDGFVADFLVPWPSASERQAISAFLDRETAKIDALVEEQRRLIELLKEKRQVVISHAVTKGLDPTVPTKDSGVEWLGEVPAHWDVNRLDRLMSFSSGKAHEPFLDDDGEHVYISARFVSTHGQSLKFCTENLAPAKRGDIVMVMSDLPNGRALARAYQIEDDASYAVNQRVCRLNDFRGSARYFYHQLNRNSGLRRYDDGVNQTHLSNSAYCKLLLCAPPELEQARIAKHLDELTDQIDELQLAATAAINVLQERRAALISAAVTGKIDVRGALTIQAEAA